VQVSLAAVLSAVAGAQAALAADLSAVAGAQAAVAADLSAAAEVSACTAVVPAVVAEVAACTAAGLWAEQAGQVVAHWALSVVADLAPCPACRACWVALGRNPAGFAELVVPVGAE
jgi:hypothetical protein